MTEWIVIAIVSTAAFAGAYVGTALYIHRKIKDGFADKPTKRPKTPVIEPKKKPRKKLFKKKQKPPSGFRYLR